MSQHQVNLTPSVRSTGGFGSASFKPGPLAPLPTKKTSEPEIVRRGVRGLLHLDRLGDQFTLLVLINLIVSLAGLIISFVIVGTISTDFNQIVNNSAPSIVAAQKLGQAIEDADAQAANYQLYSRLDVTNPDYDSEVYVENGLRQKSWNTFSHYRQEIYDLLFLARANITYPGEAEAINTIANRFFDYQAKISLMKYELDQGHKEAALALYKSAHDLLIGNLGNAPLDDKGYAPEQLLKLNGWKGFDTRRPYLGIEANIEKLSQINRAELDKAARNAKGSITLNTLIIVGVCILLVGGLGLLWVRHAMITHRIINPGYTLAFIGALGLSLTLISTLLTAARDYSTVATDSFISIEAVARVRQLAYDANADESRLLLSPDSPGLDSTNPVLSAEVRRAFRPDTLADNFVKEQILIKDQLAIAWANITYSGEKQALCQTSQNVKGLSGCNTKTPFYLDEYLKLDQAIRTNFTKNLLAEAVKLDLGTSNDTFGRFDAAMSDLSKINETEFDKSACNAIGRTQFGDNCTAQGYVPVLQYGIVVAFMLVGLSTMAGWGYIRREF